MPKYLVLVEREEKYLTPVYINAEHEDFASDMLLTLCAGIIWQSNKTKWCRASALAFTQSLKWRNNQNANKSTRHDTGRKQAWSVRH